MLLELVKYLHTFDYPGSSAAAQDKNDIRPDLANLANGSDSARDSLVDDYRLDLPVRVQSAI